MKFKTQQTKYFRLDRIEERTGKFEDNINKEFTQNVAQEKRKEKHLRNLSDSFTNTQEVPQQKKAKKMEEKQHLEIKAKNVQETLECSD